MTSRKYVQKDCENGCGTAAVTNERYCVKCRKLKLAELVDSGYLIPRVRGHIGCARTVEQKEASSYDPSPSGENAVRALEGD